QGIEGFSGRLGGGQDRYRHRHAPPALAGRAVQGSGTGDRRRGTAVRGQAQGTAEAAQEGDRRSHHERHADSADTTYVVIGPARYVRDRDPAQGPAGDPYRRGSLSGRIDPTGGGTRTRQRRAGVLLAQPGRFDLVARGVDPAIGSFGQNRGWARSDGG